jgi:hypothetical protein
MLREDSAILDLSFRQVTPVSRTAHQRVSETTRTTIRECLACSCSLPRLCRWGRVNKEG